VALHIFSYVPADACARAALVCRAWRDLLAEPCFWTELDLSSTSDVVAQVTREMLLAAAARAGGQLERLHVTYATFLPEALQAVFAANMNTLRLLRLEQSANDRYARPQEAVLRAAPPQCVVEADAFEMYENVQPMLRNQPPFQALRLRQLQLAGGVWRDGHAPAQVAALAAELVAHPSLRAVRLWNAPLDSLAALEAVVDAALALRLTKLLLENCRVSPASAVALPRLLRGDALRELALDAVLDAHAAALLADALRGNRTLTSLKLYDIVFWDDADAVASLFGALVGHASLTSIDLGHCWERRWNAAEDASAVVGALLGALVAANSPLTVLDVSFNALGDVGMGPVVDALPHNTHLRELRCTDNGMSDAFRRDRLMPALAANTSLRTLRAGQMVFQWLGHTAADRFVAARTAATV
jgi:hypothetical protein